MRSLREVKVILLGVFYGGVFVTQIIGWLIINHIGAFKKSIWCIIGTAVLMTVITCSMYLLLRKFYQIVRGSEETTLAEEIMKYLESTDKVKTCLEVLLDAQMDVRAYLTKPLKPERLLNEVLFWYKITERQLFSFRYIKVKRLYMFLLHEACFLDYEIIAEMTKCRNEVEVISGIEKIKVIMRKDINLLANAGGIVDRIKAYSEMYPE